MSAKKRTGFPEKKQKGCPEAIVVDDTQDFILQCPSCRNRMDSRKYKHGRYRCPVCRQPFRVG